MSLYSISMVEQGRLYLFDSLVFSISSLEDMCGITSMEETTSKKTFLLSYIRNHSPSGISHVFKSPTVDASWDICVGSLVDF